MQTALDVPTALKDLGFKQVQLADGDLGLDESDQRFVLGMQGRKNCISWIGDATYAVDAHGDLWRFPNEIDISELLGLEVVT